MFTKSNDGLMYGIWFLRQTWPLLNKHQTRKHDVRVSNSRGKSRTGGVCLHRDVPEREESGSRLAVTVSGEMAVSWHVFFYSLF
jgi:hypothetical protein